MTDAGKALDALSFAWSDLYEVSVTGEGWQACTPDGGKLTAANPGS
jgi:hypothetical protein